MAAHWRRVCPSMPRLADYLKQHLLHVGLARINEPYHYVRAVQDGPQPEAERHQSEIALAYLIPDPREGVHRPFYSCFGRKPFGGQRPSWWPAVEAVLGTLATNLHDGFMEQFWGSPLRPQLRWRSRGSTRRGRSGRGSPRACRRRRSADHRPCRGDAPPPGHCGSCGRCRRSLIGHWSSELRGTVYPWPYGTTVKIRLTSRGTMTCGIPRDTSAESIGYPRLRVTIPRSSPPTG